MGLAEEMNKALDQQLNCNSQHERATHDDV